MDKAETRKAMRLKRRLVGEGTRAAFGRAVAKALVAELKGARLVAAYLALEDEIPLNRFIAASPSVGRTICVPAWEEESRTYILSLLGADPGQDGRDDANGEVSGLVKGRFGVLEPRHLVPVDPAKVDAWIVPGLAFTLDGGRLGYGGGFYDRLLSKARPDARKIGVAYPFQILPAIPLESHDIRLDAVIAPQIDGLPS